MGEAYGGSLAALGRYGYLVIVCFEAIQSDPLHHELHGRTAVQINAGKLALGWGGGDDGDDASSRLV